MIVSLWFCVNPGKSGRQSGDRPYPEWDACRAQALLSRACPTEAPAGAPVNTTASAHTADMKRRFINTPSPLAAVVTDVGDAVTYRRIGRISARSIEKTSGTRPSEKKSDRPLRGSP